MQHNSPARPVKSEPEHLPIDRLGRGHFTARMRGFHPTFWLLALTLTGCASKTPTAGEDRGYIVTPEHALVGKVVRVNSASRFAVLNFPLGRLPTPDQQLDLYRHGLKVGEVRITGERLDDNVVADIVAGEAAEGDEAR